MERIESGIPGLDSMIQGGFPVPSTILLCGEPGTGKTTFALQSVFHTANQGGVCLYITATSEPSWVIRKFLSEFKFYSQKMVDIGRIIFLDINGKMSEDPYMVAELITKNVEKYRPLKIVIDPITSLKIALGKPIGYRQLLHELVTFLKTQNCVALLTSEGTYKDIITSTDAYMVDGIIILSYIEVENARKKYIEVLKLRGTRHLTGRRSVVISEEGLRVQPELR
ncbi:MAG: hypothetical protein DRO90_02940 [Candidatus Altiarchaeales archaeon]|nr:MAG: hypothetical protein DRO95_05965 [Candidatus Altiarchaeales archaeon]RLI93879.1 MAG: hypothetical protein DRO90_02940 [Candidatus Altiarchaeales archaeon]RLI94449.1 MAG: hypothetical protein DRO94_02840 [Candidatus Altiarchaeales archaeon]HDO82256.1 hypothetical protein [Candidatus Altiarchaeales archaeon]HEX54905.1 hypothetical protein [Candidatus Altiarchaeales archaeon]